MSWLTGFIKCIAFFRGATDNPAAPPPTPTTTHNHADTERQQGLQTMVCSQPSAAGDGAPCCEPASVGSGPPFLCPAHLLLSRCGAVGGCSWEAQTGGKCTRHAYPAGAGADTKRTQKKPAKREPPSVVLLPLSVVPSAAGGRVTCSSARRVQADAEAVAEVEADKLEELTSAWVDWEGGLDEGTEMLVDVGQGGTPPAAVVPLSPYFSSGSSCASSASSASLSSYGSAAAAAAAAAFGPPPPLERQQGGQAAVAVATHWWSDTAAAAAMELMAEGEEAAAAAAAVATGQRVQEEEGDEERAYAGWGFRGMGPVVTAAPAAAVDAATAAVAWVNPLGSLAPPILGAFDGAGCAPGMSALLAFEQQQQQRQAHHPRPRHCKQEQ